MWAVCNDVLPKNIAGKEEKTKSGHAVLCA